MAQNNVGALAESLVEKLKEKKRRITTAESCTGGLLAAAITDVTGASLVFGRGVVSYANEAKIEMLGVARETLAKHGAVSEETALEMAEGARKHANADIALSVTGVAGPTGGSEAKPVGLVYIGVSTAHKAAVKRFVFSGTRHLIRNQAVQEALALAHEALTQFENTPI